MEEPNNAEGPYEDSSVRQSEIREIREIPEKSLGENREGGTQDTCFLDLLPVGYFAFNTEGVITEVNRAGAVLLGEERSSLLNKPMPFFMEPSYHDLFHSHLRDALESEKIHRCELKVKRNDGTLLNVSVVSAPHMDGDGVRSAMSDITTQKKAEEKLRQNESKYRLLFEASATLLDALPYLMFTLSRDGVYLDCLVSTPNAMGLSPDSILGKHISTVLPPGAVETVWCNLQQALITSKPQVFEYAFNVSGEVRHFEGRVIPQGFDKALLVTHDITDRKAMEAELLRVRNLESISRLAGGIAHDFNNLLMAVGGYIALAKMTGQLGDEAFSFLSEAEKTALSGKNLTGQLMTFSKGGQLRMRAVRLEDVVRKATSAALKGSNIGCSYSMDPDLLPVKIDEEQMGQAIHNMVVNAMEAMTDGGTVFIRCANTAVSPGAIVSLPPGDYVELSIEDQGAGIQKKDLQKIFDPYFTTKEMGPQRGLGLGLAVCYSIVKTHGGCITVESIPGKGSVFRTYLPARGRVFKGDTESRESYHVEDVEPSRGVKKILIMDDEDAVRGVLRKMLGHMGYNVVEASDGFQTLERYEEARKRHEPFDAVILDLTVKGGMGGIETIGSLRGLDPGVKAILSTGYAMGQQIDDYKELGFAGVIPKPYNMEEMDKLLKSVMEE